MIGWIGDKPIGYRCIERGRTSAPPPPAVGGGTAVEGADHRDRAQVAALGVVSREVPHPRTHEALTYCELRKAYSRLLRDHRPVVALAAAHAVDEVRRGR